MKSESRNHNFKHKLIICLIVVFFAIIFWSSAELQKLFYDSTLLTNLYLEQYKFVGILLFLIASALSAILSPFSSVPLIPFVIAAWGNIPTFFLLVLGWFLGSIVSYFLGSFTGYTLTQKIFSKEKAERYKREISTRTNFLNVFLFRLAIPSEIAGYVLGAIKYKFSKYLLITAITESLFAGIVIYSSEALINANKGRFVLFVFLALTLTSISFYFFKKLKNNSEDKVK